MKRDREAQFKHVESKQGRVHSPRSLTEAAGKGKTEGEYASDKLE